MKSLCLILISLYCSAAFGCSFDVSKAELDLRKNIRDMFELDADTVFESRSADSNAISVPRNQKIAVVEKVMDEKSDNTDCPQQIIQINRVFTHDSYRKCNAILKSEVIRGTHEVLYRNCTANQFRSKDVAL